MKYGIGVKKDKEKAQYWREKSKCIGTFDVKGDSDKGHFENEHLSFDYSDDFRTSSINTAEHMLLKLENENSYFSISEWHYDLDASVDAWSEVVYDRYKNYPVKNGRLVTVAPKLVELKNGKEKGLLMLSNVKENGIDRGIATCLFIRQGNLFVVSYVSPKKYLSLSPCKDFFNLLKGLSFKE